VPKADGDHTYVDIWPTQLTDMDNNGSVLGSMPYEVQLIEETTDLDEDASSLAANMEVVECDSLKEQVVSECQQVITLASTCNDAAALQSMLTRVSAAAAIARTSTQHLTDVGS